VIVKEIIDDMYARLDVILPTHIVLPFQYDADLNDRIANKAISIRVGGSETIAGVNKFITMSHTFSIGLYYRYENKKGAGDRDLRDKINDSHSDIETVYKEFYRRPMTAISGQVIVVQPLSIAEPDVNAENNYVSVVLDIGVQYRVASN
jgi:hypothetical protein